MAALRGLARLPLHPVLFAAYPVLFLFSQNLREQITIEPLLAPLALAVAAAIGVTLALWLAFRNRHAGALLATAVIGLVFGYGHAWNLVGGALDEERYLLIVWLLLFAAAVALVIKLRRRARRMTPALNVIAGALVVFNLLPIAGYQARELWAAEQSVAVAEPSPGASGAPVSGGRDIYYLIFDRYASERTLHEEYEYDNSPFLEELRRRGFYVADDSTANYLKTAQSLASSLNFEYLDLDALEQRAASPDDFQPFYEMLRGSFAVERFLHGRGYRYIHLGNFWPPTQRNTAADVSYVYSGLPEFSAELLGTTLFRAFFAPGGRDVARDEPPFFHAQYEYTSYQLDRLRRVADLRGPKFVFAHVVLPHWPYVFDREGEYVPRREQRALGETAGYVGQLEYTNAYILDLVDTLLAVPERERPIILIQADEGPPPVAYTANERSFRWLDATQEQLDMKFQILNAYYLPGVDPEEAGLYRGITPVNSFRVVFNAYFGTQLEVLPDRNLVFHDQAHLYQVFDVSDRVLRGLDEAERPGGSITRFDRPVN